MVKTIVVEDSVWEKLVILKLKMKKRNMNDVVEELMKYYDNAGKAGKDVDLTAVRDDNRPTTAETSTAKVEEQKPQIHTWCRKKDSIKYFKAFLDWVDRNYKVVDWWEEGDSYCFETEKPPKS
jgi:hypothetical protein